MCGLVAVVGRPPAPVLRAAIAGAGRRGPHSHGWASFSAGAWGVISRRPGPMTAGPLAGPAVGHSRLATCGAAPGDAPPVDESMPFLAGGFALAHNGRVPAARTVVDSEALLAELVAAGRVDALPGLLPEDCPHAAVVGDAAGLVWLVRAAGGAQPAHPLYVLRGPGWAVATSGFLPTGHLAPAGLSALEAA